MQQQYAAMVSQRDALLNERDGLLVGLQQARRANGLEPLRARANKQRLAFPIQLLPEGRAPNIFVVDIGAQNLTHEEHAYQSLATAGPVKVTGFEPLADAARKRADSEPNVVMLNHFIGDGGAGIFHINRDDSTSSLLDSNIAFLERFEALSTMCSTIRREPVTTTRLDDVSELTDCDFLKIDVQGGELDVLKGAPTTRARAVVVHCEVEFSQLYTDQPLFGAIDEHLRSAGFELIDILNLGYATVKSLPRPIARSRLLWGEAVYMRAPDSILTLGPQKIIGAAYIAHVNYGMYDVAAEYLSILDRNGASNYANSYGAIVAAPDFELKSNVEIA